MGAFRSRPHGLHRVSNRLLCKRVSGPKHPLHSGDGLTPIPTLLLRKGCCRWEKGDQSGRREPRGPGLSSALRPGWGRPTHCPGLRPPASVRQTCPLMPQDAVSTPSASMQYSHQRKHCHFPLDRFPPI